MIRLEKSKVRHHCATRPKSPDIKASRRTLFGAQVGNVTARDEPPMATDRETGERDDTDLFVRRPVPLVGSTLEHTEVDRAGSVSNLAICHSCTDLGSALLLGQPLGASHAEHGRSSNSRSNNTLILAVYSSRC
jgi:hypothetical protein